MADEVWRRTHNCLDHAGRPRELVIRVEHGKVSLHTPPGEVATMHPRAIGPFRDDMADAQVEALTQRGRF